MSETVTVAAGPLRDRLVERLARGLRLHVDDAATTVEHWLRSEQAGKPCHGLVRALYVIKSQEFGPYDGTPAPGPTRSGPGVLHVDGTGHLGYPIVRRLVERGCDEAIEHGTCVVTGVGVYPSGMLGDSARLACERGCGVLLMSGSPPRVAAPDGRVPLLGTNPLCIGLPTSPQFFICDASTSTLTHGDFLIARSSGAALPVDAAIDEHGVRTTAAADVEIEAGRGALLSVGGSHKTFAMSMAIELLTSLGGGVPGSPKLAEHGVFALFLGPSLVAGAGPVLAASLGRFVEAGARIPGWVSQARAEGHAREGTVELSTETHARLLALLEDA